MAAIQFPNNPNAGDLFTASNGIRYTYDGEKWKTLGTSTVGTEGQFLETPTELTIDKVIPGNTNTGAVGSLAIGAGVTLTVPATSSFRTLLGKSGTYGIPETGGTFTGPVSFDDNTIIKGNSNDGSGELTLNCENNSHGIKIKGPPHSAGATYTLILPNDIGTSGQVLTTNGSGVSSWSTIDLSSKLSLTGGTLTGGLTGTTGNFSGSITSTNVAFGFTSNATSFPFTSDSTLGNGGKAFYAKHSNPGGAGSYLFYGENNAGEAFSVTTAGTATFAGNVLINTTTLPTSDSKLTVQSGTHCEVNIIASPSHGSVINMGDTDDYNIGRIKYDNSSNSMQFQTNNSEKMRIDGSGQVGIGISSGISNTLHVFKSGDGQTPVRFETSNSNGKLRFYNDSNGWSLDSEGDLRFTTSRTGSGTPTRMKIDSSGKLLLGTTSGTSVIRSHFDGTGWGGGNGSNTTSGLSTPQFLFDGVDLDNSGTVNPVGFQIRGGGGGVPRGYALGVYGRYATSGLAHLFFVRNTGASPHSSTSNVPGAGVFRGDTDAYGSPAGSSWWNYSAPANFGIKDSVTGTYDGSSKVGQTIELGGTYGGGSYNNWGGTCSAVRIATNFGASSNGTNIGYYADISAAGSGNNWGLYIANGGAAKPGGGSFTATSDARVKNVFGNYERGLNELLQLNPVKFAYNGKAKTPADDQERIGLLAQDVQPIMPELVSSRSEKLNEDDEENTNILMVDPSDLVFTLVNAIKELSAQNAALEQRLTDAGIA